MLSDLFPDGVYPELAEHHIEYLHKAAITDDVLESQHIFSNEALDAIVFPWTNGEEIVYVTRPDQPKSIKNRYTWPPNVQLILWKLREAIGDNYLLVEGVKQCLSVLSWAPYQYGVMGMNGAWGWSKTDLSWAENKNITVFLDGDRKVNEKIAKAADALQNALERIGAKSITFAALPSQGTRGIDDYLAKKDPDERTNYIQVLVEGAQFSGRRLVLKTAMDYKPKRKRWLYNNFIPLGNLTILAGYEGTAKSTVTTDIVARITNGELDGEFYGTPKKVMYITGEEDWDEDILPRLIAAGANRSNVLTTFVEHESGIETLVSLQHDLKDIETYIKEHDVAMIVFDSLLYFLGNNVNIDSAAPINDILLPLVRVGIQNSCTILGILHFNKGSHNENPLNKIANSKAFARIARSILMTAAIENHFVFSAEKLSSAVKSPGLKFRLETVRLSEEYWEDDRPINSVKINWMGQSDVTVSEIMAMMSRGETLSSSEVDQWLMSYLDSRGGQAPFLEIKDAAKNDGVGYSDSTLGRARQRLHIENERTGFGKGSTMIWKYNDVELDNMRERVREGLGM